MTPTKTIAHSRLDEFFRLLAGGDGAALFNPWTQRDEVNDATLNGPIARRRRLRTHLRLEPTRILLGEAAGYQGCHISGIPFTSERVLMEGRVPRVSCNGQRLSIRTRPWSEPSATIVWKTLHELKIAHDTILWNAYPWHPHRPGNPQSNRTPTRTERALGMPVLDALLRAFPKAALFAVGRHAEQALFEVGRDATPLRHPSMGGATLFHQGLQAAIDPDCKVRVSQVLKPPKRR